MHRGRARKPWVADVRIDGSGRAIDVAVSRVELEQTAAASQVDRPGGFSWTPGRNGPVSAVTNSLNGLDVHGRGDVTAATRELHITKALDEQRQRPGGGESTTLFFRGKRELFPVIELPLTVPTLRARSFRIAPLLEDHPKRDAVEQDPESDDAQAVVAELVAKAHRYKEGLKESLHVDGQDQPGVTTRSGKLINGNSRCVLLRELVHEGTIHSSTTIRVAVLPSDTSNREELDLESTLQGSRVRAALHIPLALIFPIDLHAMALRKARAFRKESPLEYMAKAGAKVI